MGMGCGSHGAVPDPEDSPDATPPVPPDASAPDAEQGLPDELPEFTPEELEPTEATDGIPAPMTDVYTDLGAAPLNDRFRALMGFPIRDFEGLTAAIDDIYDPASPNFRNYMTAQEWIDTYSPSELDFHLVKLWIESKDMEVGYEATNRLMFQFTGTVAQFNEAFQTELRVFSRKNPQSGNPDIPVYGTLGPLTVPTWVSERVSGIITADLPASTDQLPGEGGQIESDPPPNIWRGRTIDEIAGVYGYDDLYAQGFTGQGVKLGLVVGATFKYKDLQSFWQGLGLLREEPQVFETMEPIATRYLEATIDVEWAGALAPGADLMVYEGPDSRNTSMVFTFNEAIALNEVDIITDSFAHREDSEPEPVRLQYHYSAAMAAALGITVMAATGDSARTDTPSSSPYVTGVGGTRIYLDGNGNLTDEVAWSGSGSGPTLSFDKPWWQQGVVLASGNKRAVADVALNASPGSAYWVYYLGEWRRYGGTSFSSPCFAGMIAVVNSYRAAQGLPRVGWINSILYTTPSVQAAFRDIIAGSTPYHSATPGWDYPTGWGAPMALEFAQAMP